MKLKVIVLGVWCLVLWEQESDLDAELRLVTGCQPSTGPPGAKIASKGSRAEQRRVLNCDQSKNWSHFVMSLIL